MSILSKNVKKRNIFNHSLAVEAIMRSLAKHLGENVESWGLVGLLHDVDFENTENNPLQHGLAAERILGDNVSSEVVRAIKAHNFENTNVKPETRMEKALIAADAISGLLVACALVMPSKKLAEVKVETVAKKFKQKDFARNVKRDKILLCEEIGIKREKFFEICLEGLKKVSKEIGL
ncbi:MAG: HDIG domain-containing protein [Candidatus Bathyarchaeota archaeon]|nr:HDIG domain-containing protein [Candidatus Bathyarchaeota archaeon]